MTSTANILRENPRRDTAKMLGINLGNMTAAQEVRLARCCMLRLELDDIEARKLSNQQFDIKAYIAASEALERLMGGDPVTGADGDFETRYNERVQAEFAGAHDKLSQLLSDHAAHHEAALLSDNPALRAAALRHLSPGVNAIIAELKAEIAALKLANEQLCGLHPPPATPTPEQTTPPQTSNQPPLPPRSPTNTPPAAYLAKYDEPWRPYVVEGGVSTSLPPPGSSKW
jgi:hypothetical protein